MSDWSAGQPPRRPRPQGPGNYDYYRGAQQPPQRPAPPPSQPPPGPPPTTRGPAPRPARKKRRWGRRIGITVVVLVALVAGLVVYADSTLQRTAALDYPGRIPDTPGTNWLLVGSDSRDGLSEEQLAELSAGEAGSGRRTDTMMLLHIPASGGQPSIISFPRDSLVPVEGLGSTKLNAAFSEGGSTLLAKTLETATGIHIDRYAEIGLGGFAGLVDAVGGVDMCLDEPMDDWRAGVKLEAGCQKLDGAQALGFVRARYSLDGGDLERSNNQRKLLGALVKKASSPGTVLNPFKLVPLLNNAGKTFTVNKGDHIWNLAWLALAMGDISGGKGVTTQVPFGDFGTSDSGDSVIEWDSEAASRMFEAVAADKPIPADVLEN